MDLEAAYERLAGYGFARRLLLADLQKHYLFILRSVASGNAAHLRVTLLEEAVHRRNVIQHFRNVILGRAIHSRNVLFERIRHRRNVVYSNIRAIRSKNARGLVKGALWRSSQLYRWLRARSGNRV